MDFLFKKFISEIIGTFISLSTIIVVINQLKPNVNFLKIGLVLSIVILIPQFLINKQLLISEFFTYIIAQVLGATLALGLFKTLYS